MGKTCKTCVFLLPTQSQCQLLTGQKVNPEADICPKYDSVLLHCELCDSTITKSSAIIEVKNEDHVRVVCERCFKALGTCTMCRYGQECIFETDPSSLPKVVQKEIRQGPMITVTQVKNPDRIEITCKTKCSCYDPENECLKQFNTCGKYEDLHD